MGVPEYALELLLGYDGRLHYFASGHYLKWRKPEADHWHRTEQGIAFEIVDEKEG